MSIYSNTKPRKQLKSRADVRSLIVEILRPHFAAIDPINHAKADDNPDKVSVAAELLAWDSADAITDMLAKAEVIR